MSDLKLNIAVGLLTRRSHHMIRDPHTGKYQVVLAEPLLVQLRMAVGNSHPEGQGSASSSGKPIPMSADAHDMLQRIDEEVTAQWWYTHPVHRGRGRESLAGKLLAWVAAARLHEESLKAAEKVVRRWVAEIEGLFNPQRRRPLPGAVCPNKKCGASRVLDREEDGEHFYKPALVKLYDDEGFFDSMECGACGESWNRLGLELMAP